MLGLGTVFSLKRKRCSCFNLFDHRSEIGSLFIFSIERIEPEVYKIATQLTHRKFHCSQRISQESLLFTTSENSTLQIWKQQRLSLEVYWVLRAPATYFVHVFILLLTFSLYESNLTTKAWELFLSNRRVYKNHQPCIISEFSQ